MKIDLGTLVGRQMFARKIRHAIMEKGWTPAELARRADLTREAIAGYMRAQVTPSDDSIQRLATALDATPEELLSPIASSSSPADPSTPRT